MTNENTESLARGKLLIAVIALLLLLGIILWLSIRTGTIYMLHETPYFW